MTTYSSILYQFGSTVLSQHMPSSDLGSGSSQDSMIALPSGGGFDPNGSQAARLRPYTVSHRCTLVDTTTAALQTQLETLKALVGTRDKLYRRVPIAASPYYRDDWVYARLMSVQCNRTIANILTLDVTLTFAIGSPCWNGALHNTPASLVTGAYVLANNGNYPVRNCYIQIRTPMAGAADLTGISIEKDTPLSTTETYLDWAGVVNAYPDMIENLAFDCGAFRVINMGVDAFDEFTRHTMHSIPEWLCLNPGNNTINITRTGGSSAYTINFIFYDGWA